MANSKIYLGNTNIGSLFQGASDVSIYLGLEKVYPLEEPSFKWKATYSDSSVTSAECDSSSAITEGEINKTNLVSVEIGDCVTSIGQGAFNYCVSLTSIDIPNSVTSIGNSAFQGCTSLTSCTIGSGVTSIGYSAFQGCSNLTSVTINATTPPTLGAWGVFDSSTCPIYVPCESLEAYKSASGWSTYASRIACPQFEGKWKATYQDSHVESAECDSSNAIEGGDIDITDLASVEIGQCVDTIGDYAFGHCDSLASIDIPDSVTSIGDNAFAYCTSLTSVTIGSGVTSIGYSAFRGCSSLASITVNATTPPSLGMGVFDEEANDRLIYVPSTSIGAYESAWSDYYTVLRPIPNS